MVLLVPCYSATLASTCTFESSSDELFYEVPSGLQPPMQFSQQPICSQPVPLRSCYDSSCKSDDAVLSTSADSVSSFRSNCSSRSAAEREAERSSRRRLLEVSVGKLQAQRDHPLRKHLLVYNTIKTLQRDLDMLDDEELYCSLIDDHENRMEVDECPWPQPAAVTDGPLPTAAVTRPSVPEPVKISVWDNQNNNNENNTMNWKNNEEPAALQPLNSIQEAFGSWWASSGSPAPASSLCSPPSPHSFSSSSSSFSNTTNFGVTSSVAGGWGAPYLSARGSSLADDPTSDGVAPFDASFWGHLDDLDSNPLGQSWLSTRELSSLFAPHLHHSNELLMQA